MRGKLQPGSKPPEYLIETTRKHIEEDKVQQSIKKIGKHSKKCTFYTLRFGCSFAAVNTIKPQLL